MHNALWDHQLLVVIGKGGVGRTSVAAGLGVAAAKAGKKTCIVEMGGLSDLATTFGFEQPSYAPRTVLPGLDIRSVSAADCLDDFGKRKLRLGRLSQRFMRSRVLGAFVDAVPGLHDLLQLGKIENAMNEPLADEPDYDLTILDAPATGHGLSMLFAARTMRRMARVGPFAELARIIELWLSDRTATAFVLVTLAEELPLHECLHFVEQLGDDRHHLDTIVFNRLSRTVVPDVPDWPTVNAHLTTQDRPDLQAIADYVTTKVTAQRHENERVDSLINQLRSTFNTSPRIARVQHDEGGPARIASYLGSLGATP